MVNNIIEYVDKIPLKLGYIFALWLLIFLIITVSTIGLITPEGKEATSVDCLEYEYDSRGSQCIEFGEVTQSSLGERIVTNLYSSVVATLGITLLSVIFYLISISLSIYKEAKEDNFYYSSPRVKKIAEFLHLKEK